MAKTNEQKLRDARERAEIAVKAHNELILDGKIDDKVEQEIVDAVNEYTSIARLIAFIECKSAENPMHEACIRLTFPTIKAKSRPVEEGSKIKVLEIDDSAKVIDLKKLMKFCDGHLGADDKWVYALEKFNFLMTAQKARDLGIRPTEINDSYSMRDISRQYDLGKNPASKTNLLKTLTTIVQMMIGEEFKPVSHDVNFLLSIYSKKGRNALQVSCANHTHMRQYVQEICHRILTDGVYNVDFKRASKK